MVRKGRTKPNVAGERYDSNAIPLEGARGPAGTGGMPGMGGMGDMQQMMEMMQKMGGMGGMGGMPGMPPMGPLAGLMPPGGFPMPVEPRTIYHGLPEGTVIDKTFFTFYPNYINAKKTVQEGRRIPKDKACEDPIAEEMSEICSFLKLPHVHETAKKYPRDWMVAGRVRVRLMKSDGTLENPEIPSRKQLMLKMGELIPRLQSRKERLEKEAEAAKQSEANASKASAAPTSSTGGKKKGKKKGRR